MPNQTPVALADSNANLSRDNLGHGQHALFIASVAPDLIQGSEATSQQVPPRRIVPGTSASGTALWVGRNGLQRRAVRWGLLARNFGSFLLGIR